MMHLSGQIVQYNSLTFTKNCVVTIVRYEKQLDVQKN